MALAGQKWVVYKPGSVQSKRLVWLFISTDCCQPALAANPDPSAANMHFFRSGSLFGLAPGGVYHAIIVTNYAVRSYRTFSPLPACGRYFFCGTFPKVISPAGRYPAPYLRGARTFLYTPLCAATIRLPFFFLSGNGGKSKLYVIGNRSEQRGRRDRGLFSFQRLDRFHHRALRAIIQDFF